MVVCAFLAQRANEKDRPDYVQGDTPFKEWPLQLHIRQELKIIAYLLGGILIMLGIVADRIG